MEQPLFRMRRIISIGLVAGLAVCLCLLPGCGSPSGSGTNGGGSPAAGTPKPLGSASRGQGSGNGYPNRVLRIVSYSPNGDLLAVGYYGRNGGELELWDTKNLQKQPIVIPAHGEQIQTLSFSPNSRWLAYGSENGDGIVRVLDTSNLTGNPVELRGHGYIVRTVAFGPDSKTLATLDSDSTFRVWDINNPSNPIKTTSRPDLLRDMTISPDGKTLALSSSMVSSVSSPSTAVDLWDFPDLKGPPQKLPGNLRITSGHAFSPDGRLIAVGVSTHGQTNFKPNSQVERLTNPAVEIWDLTNPEAKPILLAGEDCRTSIDAGAFSWDSKWFANMCVTQGIVQVWDLGSPNAPPKTFSHDAAFNVSFSPDGKTLASGSMHDSILLWDYHQSSPVPTAIAKPPWAMP